MPTPNRRSGQNVVWMTCYRLIILSDQYRLSLGTASQLARVWPDTTIFCHWHGTCSLQNGAWEFDVHVTVHRDKFLIIKPNRCTNFSNLFWKETTCFGQFLCPSSGVFHCTHSNGICHTGLLTACKQDQDGAPFHPDPVCTVKNSWWWTEELSETCRISFQK